MADKKQVGEGRFLAPGDRKLLAREKKRRARSVLGRRLGSLAALVLGDGLLIYMIDKALIDQLFGALFVAIVSVFFTCKIK